ncbi:hypothetical protein BIW22_20770 [Salmonella enterica]|nr:hypothetical protein [Salmonella enterica]
MKPMLKADFFKTVTDVLAKGLTPELTVSPLTCWGRLSWTDAEGNKQTRALFSSHDCSPLTSRISRKRFVQWFAEAKAQFHEKAAQALTVGDRVMYGANVGTVTVIRLRTVCEPNGTPKAKERTGVIVIDDKYEMMAGELRAIDLLDEDDFKALCFYMFMLEGHRHIIQVVQGAVIMRWANSGTTSRNKQLSLYTSDDQKLVEGHARVLTRWFDQANKDAEDYARDQMLSDQAMERASKRWFEEHGGY